MVTIPGIPNAIYKEDYVRLVALVGLDIDSVSRLEFTPNGIYAEVFARVCTCPDVDIKAFDEVEPRTMKGLDAKCCVHGKPARMLSDGSRAAMHRIFIPVVDD